MLLAPVAAAAPQVLSASDSLVAITSSDALYQNTGQNVAGSLVTPSGERVAFNGGVSGTFTCGGFSFDQRVEAPGVGTPADGTWTIEPFPETITPNRLCLSVAGKTILFCNAAARAYVSNSFQLWNWRSTASDFVDEGAADPEDCPAPVNQVPPTDDTDTDPEEDPNNAVYFRAPVARDADLETAPASPSADPSDSWDLNGVTTQGDPVEGREFNADPTGSVFVWIKTSDCGASCAADLRTETGETVIDHGDLDGCTGTCAESENVAGLDPSTSYSFQFIGIYGEPGDPAEDIGQVLEFTTTDTADADVDENADTAPAEAGANPATTWTLQGAVSGASGAGRTFTDSLFVYIPTASCGTSCDSDLRLETGETVIDHVDPLTLPSINEATVSTLTPDTSYSFQFIGVFSSGSPLEDLGTVLTFTTQSNDPTPITDTSTVTCASNTATLNGDWVRHPLQTLNTFATFYYVQGIPAGDTDLRDNLGAASTGYVDKGAGSSGTHTGTITYNNAAGNTYQLVVKNGASGPEQLGNLMVVAPAQCTVSDPTIPLTEVHSLDDFNIVVSQAQCNGDLVSFRVLIDLSSAATTITDMDVTVIDSFTDTNVLTVDDSEMFQQGNKLWYFAKILPAGPYVAHARIDVNALGGFVDSWDAYPFNVPQGTCVDTPFDPSGILDELDDLRSFILGQHNQTRSLTNTTSVFQGDQTRDLINTTHTHIDSHFNTTNALIVNQFMQTNGYVNTSRIQILDAINNINVDVDCGDNATNCTFAPQSIVDFPGLTDEQVGAFLLFFVVLILSFFQRWLFVAIACVIGILDVFVLGGIFGFEFTALLLVIAVMLQIYVDHRDAHREEAAQREAKQDGLSDGN